MRRLFALFVLVALLVPLGGYALMTDEGNPTTPPQGVPSPENGCCVCRKGNTWTASSIMVRYNPAQEYECEDYVISGAADACDTYQGSGQKCDSQFIQDVLRKRQAGATVIPVTPPELNVGIPGLEFTPQLAIKGDEPNQFYMIPWIAEYLNAIYKFGVGVAAVLAVVVIVIGGFIWLTAGGNTSQVDTARGYIQGAIIGLILALGGYTILAIINPELVNLRPLRVPYVKYEEIEIEQWDSSSASRSSSLTSGIQVGQYCGCVPWRSLYTSTGLKTQSEISEEIGRLKSSSPLKDVAGTIASSAATVQVSPAFALAIWKHDSDLATAGAGAKNKNPGNVRCGRSKSGPGWQCSEKDFRVYTDYTVAVTDWFNSTQKWKMWQQSTTVKDVISKYAPPNENNTGHYIDVVMSYLAKYNTNLQSDKKGTGQCSC